MPHEGNRRWSFGFGLETKLSQKQGESVELVAHAARRCCGRGPAMTHGGGGGEGEGGRRESQAAGGFAAARLQVWRRMSRWHLEPCLQIVSEPRRLKNHPRGRLWGLWHAWRLGSGGGAVQWHRSLCLHSARVCLSSRLCRKWPLPRDADFVAGKRGDGQGPQESKRCRVGPFSMGLDPRWRQGCSISDLGGCRGHRQQRPRPFGHRTGRLHWWTRRHGTSQIWPSHVANTRRWCLSGRRDAMEQRLDSNRSTTVAARWRLLLHQSPCSRNLHLLASG